MGSFAEEAAAKKVELKDIPKEVSDAAKEKVKGFEAKDATVADDKEGKEFIVNGTADGKAVAVEVDVDKAGKVVKAEVKKEEAKKEEVKQK
jgi:hypothetical protein